MGELGKRGGDMLINRFVINDKDTTMKRNLILYCTQSPSLQKYARGHITTINPIIPSVSSNPQYEDQRHVP